MVTYSNCVLLRQSHVAQDTSNGVQSADVVLYGLGLVIPLMNAELLKVCSVCILTHTVLIQQCYYIFDCECLIP